MSGKLARFFGIVGGGLTLLPNLISIVSYLVTLSLPDEGMHFEIKGYTSGALFITILPCLIAATGFFSSFFVRRKPLLTGVLMLTCGLLMTLLIPISYFGISAMFEPNIIIYNNISWLLG